MEKRCSAPGCNDYLLARGLCRKHYMRLMRKGSIADERKNAAKVCQREGCENKATVYGFCHNHRKKPPTLHPGRICEFCDKPIPETRRINAQFCSRECKNAERIASGKAAVASRKSYFGSRWGLSVERIDELAANGCEICGTKEWGGRHNRPCVDHDHKTGEFRGILCSECNNGIGKLKDDPNIVRAALEYLLK